jgi:hypothetical protein
LTGWYTMPIFLASQAPATATEKPSLLEPKVFHRQLRWTRQRFGSGCYVRLHCHALEFLIAKNIVILHVSAITAPKGIPSLVNIPGPGRMVEQGL